MADLQRRRVLKTSMAMAVGIAAGAVVHGYGWARHALTIRRTELRLDALPPGLDGLRVAFLTDLHLSSLVPATDIERAVQMANAERPDMVVLGGDYVSFQDPRYMEPVAELLGGLRAPHGVFGIVGNHDDERQMPTALRRRGVEMLLDARTALVVRGEELHVAGLKFWTRKLGDVAAVVRGAKSPVLLLAHDPRRLAEAAKLGVAAVLSGHTHGGQIVIPGLGAIAARKFPVAAGHVSQGVTELFVSRGIGTVYVPLRVNCPPEVAVVTLRRAGRTARR